MEPFLIALLGTAFSVAIGWAWYSKFLFGNIWRRSVGLPAEERKKGQFKNMIAHAIGLYILNYVLLISVSGAEATISYLLIAFWLWLGFVATTHLIPVLWEKRSISYFYVNALYSLVAMLVSAIIFSLF